MAARGKRRRAFRRRSESFILDPQFCCRSAITDLISREQGDPDKIHSNNTIDSTPQPTVTALPTGIIERPAVLRIEMVTGSAACGSVTS